MEFKNHFSTSYDLNKKQYIFEQIKKQKENIGHYKLPYMSEDIINKIEHKKQIMPLIKNNQLKNIVIIGTGGSSLGTKALQSTLKTDDIKIDILFLENCDCIYIDRVLTNISLNNTLFCIVSKSGTTLECIAIAKYIFGFYDIYGKDVFKKHFLSITDYDSPLHKASKELGIEIINIQDNVVGRFSVLSSVGMSPLYLAGYDIACILDGAKKCMNDFFDDKTNIIQKALLVHGKPYQNMVLFSYSSLFKDFNSWYIQLLSESLGKIDTNGNRVGLNPIGLIGSIDQHSFLQLILDGPRDKIVSFIKIENMPKNLHIPNIKIKHLEKLDFLNDKSLHSVLNLQCDNTIQRLLELNIDTDLIAIDTINGFYMGYLIAYFELLSACLAVLFGVNAYNQPGVEKAKEKFKL